ncbi:MAG TPA: hypothetical protein VII83_00130 [Gaiellaceae bacterium]|jgi:hypothetical protein
MIYCVIPPELVDDLFDRMVEYYKDNPNVEVIVDRRVGSEANTTQGEAKEAQQKRRARIPGTFPEINAH